MDTSLVPDESDTPILCLHNCLAYHNFQLNRVQLLTSIIFLPKKFLGFVFIKFDMMFVIIIQTQYNTQFKKNFLLSIQISSKIVDLDGQLGFIWEKSCRVILEQDLRSTLLLIYPFSYTVLHHLFFRHTVILLHVCSLLFCCMFGLWFHKFKLSDVGGQFLTAQLDRTALLGFIANHRLVNSSLW